MKRGLDVTIVYEFAFGKVKVGKSPSIQHGLSPWTVGNKGPRALVLNPPDAPSHPQYTFGFRGKCGCNAKEPSPTHAITRGLINKRHFPGIW